MLAKCYQHNSSKPCYWLQQQQHQPAALLSHRKYTRTHRIHISWQQSERKMTANGRVQQWLITVSRVKYSKITTCKEVSSHTPHVCQRRQQWRHSNIRKTQHRRLDGFMQKQRCYLHLRLYKCFLPVKYTQPLYVTASYNIVKLQIISTSITHGTAC